MERSPGKSRADAADTSSHPPADAREPDAPESRRHDQTYKGTFFHLPAARPLVGVFARRWRDFLDLSTAEFIPTEAVARKSRRRHWDFAVRVWFKHGKSSVIFLVEFESSRRADLPLRVCDYHLGMYEVLHANPKLLDPGGVMPVVVPCVLYTGPTPWKEDISLADLTRPAKLPAVVAEDVAGLELVHSYRVVDLQAASEEGTLPKDTVLAWVGALEREPWESFREVHAALAEDWVGEEHEPFRKSFAEWMDERLRSAGVPKKARDAIVEQIIRPRKEADMGWTYQEWAEGHRSTGRAEQGREMVLLLASRKFGTETAERLDGLVGAMGSEQLLRVGAAVVDCETGDDLLAEVANGASVTS